MTVVDRHLVLGVLLAIATAACATTGAVPRPFPGASAPPIATVPTRTPTPTPPTSTDVLTTPPVATPLLAAALSYRGVPYRNGGSDPTGFDCSGFVQWVFAQQGRALPREVREQYQIGKQVDRNDVQPGDLVFFETVSRGASHVGIALGNDQFVHAPSSRGVVRTESYSIDYWKQRYVGARRLE
jgi:cell wall-associated NlpC family hydrolase